VDEIKKTWKALSDEGRAFFVIRTKQRIERRKMANWNVSRDGDKLIEVLEKILVELQNIRNQLNVLGSTTEISNKVIAELKRKHMTE